MKVHWSDLSQKEQSEFGDGCTFVPDFIFTANCRQHDFYYTRGGSLWDKIVADYYMCWYMLCDSSKFWHYLVSLCYWLGLTFLPISYLFFEWGNYKSKDEILTL